jgi:hypothetical protein
MLSPAVYQSSYIAALFSSSCHEQPQSLRLLHTALFSPFLIPSTTQFWYRMPHWSVATAHSYFTVPSIIISRYDSILTIMIFRIHLCVP